MGAGITYVVVPSMDEAKALLAGVADWSAAGLVRRFLVLTTADVVGVDDPVAAWAPDGSTTSCQRALAEVAYETVRVVAYQRVHRGTAGDPDVVAAAETLADVLSRRLSPTQRLRSFNVLVPDEYVRNLPLDLLSLRSSANLVVAPEDRESPQHASHPLDEEGRFQEHGLLNIMTAAGLWAVQVGGPFDDVSLQANTEVPEVTIVRGFARIARAYMLVENVGRAVLTQRGSAPWAAEAVGGIPASDPSAIARAQSDRFIARHPSAFSFVPPAPAKTPPLRHVGPLEAFRYLFSYLIRGLRGLPGELADQAAASTRRAVAEFAQAVTYGSDSRVRVQDGLADDEGTPEDVSAAVGDLASTLLQRAGGATPTPPAEGDAWKDLRLLCFGLIDGSELPSGFDRPSDGVVHEVVTDGSALAPDPLSGSFRLEATVRALVPRSARSEVRPCDALQARHVRASLDEVLAGNEATELSEDETTAVEEERGRLDAWVDARDDSLTWRVSEHLAHQIEAAEDTLGRSLARVKQGAPSSDGLLAQQARRTLHRAWAIWAVVVVLGATWSLGEAGYETLTGAELTSIAAASLLVLLVGWTVAFARFLRRMFQIRHRLDREAAEYNAAIEAAILAAGALLRLTSVNHQLREWGEAIGWMIHHPEGPLGSDGAADDCDVSFEPASHVFGTALWDERGLTRLGAIVGKRIFGRSWLTDLFANYRDEAVAQLKHERGQDESSPDPDPDWDVRTPGPRSYLLEKLQSRELADGWTRQLFATVADLLNELPSQDLFEQVRDEQGVEEPARVFLTNVLSDLGSEGPPGDLSVPLWRNEARMRQRERIGSTYVWTTTPVDARAPHVHVLAVARGAVEQRSSYDAVVLRFDHTVPAPYTDLTLFTEKPTFETPVGAPATSPDDVW